MAHPSKSFWRGFVNTGVGHNLLTPVAHPSNSWCRRCVNTGVYQMLIIFSLRRVLGPQSLSLRWLSGPPRFVSETGTTRSSSRDHWRVSSGCHPDSLSPGVASYVCDLVRRAGRATIIGFCPSPARWHSSKQKRRDASQPLPKQEILRQSTSLRDAVINMQSTM